MIYITQRTFATWERFGKELYQSPMYRAPNKKKLLNALKNVECKDPGHSDQITTYDNAFMLALQNLRLYHLDSTFSPDQQTQMYYDNLPPLIRKHMALRDGKRADPEIRDGVGRGRLAPCGSAPPCRAPRPNDACTAEGGFLPPRARPRARGRVFAPSPTMLGPFAPQRVAATHRSDVAEGFEASCCLPLAMAVRACTCTCDCTATVTPTAVGGHEMGSKASAAKAGGRLEPPSTLAPC